MTNRIGFIGIGVMGTPLCKRLLEAGYLLTIYHYRAEKTRELARLGARVADTPASLAADSDIVIVMVRDSATVEQVVLAPDGVIEGARPSTVVIDMGSSDPSSTRRIARLLAERNVRMLDAPVAGGPDGCESGTLTIMVGGDDEPYRRCEPMLQMFGKAIFRLGNVGTGHTMKTVNNMMLAINLLGVCEGLVLGVRAGLTAADIFEVVGHASGASYALSGRAAPHILTGDFQPPSLDNLTKDVAVATSIGRENNVPLVAGNLIHQVLMTAQNRGMSHMDDTCIVKLFEEAAAVRVCPAAEQQSL